MTQRDAITRTEPIEALVIGAGFGGIGTLYKLREAGIPALVLESAPEIGGTWYWNKYPGARTDSESYYYCYSFSDELLQDWNWKERFAEREEIIDYLNHVVDRFDLRRDIQLSTRVEAARWNEGSSTWHVTTSDGETFEVRYLITALGFLSDPHLPEVAGIEDFAGDIQLTSRWPEAGVDVAGLRVALIGTGSSGVQILPHLAKEAAQVTVFQRTANYVLSAQNRPISAEERASIKGRYEEIWKETRDHWFAMHMKPIDRLAKSASEEELKQVYEEAWELGGLRFMAETFADITYDLEANETASAFIRSKITEAVNDPATAELLIPRNHGFGAKRPPTGDGYYETFNLQNVSLVDVSSSPIEKIVADGVVVDGQLYPADIIIFATGFDAVTGAIGRVDITGRDGLSLKEKWDHNLRTYLGLTTAGFPNLFMVSGPHSPFANLPTCIEENADWIVEAIGHVKRNSLASIEASEAAENDWAKHVNEIADALVMKQGAGANSWFAGTNIQGKTQAVNVYFGGADDYFRRCRAVVDAGFPGMVETPEKAVVGAQPGN